MMTESLTEQTSQDTHTHTHTHTHARVCVLPGSNYHPTFSLTLLLFPTLPAFSYWSTAFNQSFREDCQSQMCSMFARKSFILLSVDVAIHFQADSHFSLDLWKHPVLFSGCAQVGCQSKRRSRTGKSAFLRRSSLCPPFSRFLLNAFRCGLTFPFPLSSLSTLWGAWWLGRLSVRLQLRSRSHG